MLIKILLCTRHLKLKACNLPTNFITCSLNVLKLRVSSCRSLPCEPYSCWNIALNKPDFRLSMGLQWQAEQCFKMCLYCWSLDKVQKSMCVWMLGVWVYVPMCMNAHVWRPEVDLGCLSPVLFTLCIEARCLPWTQSLLIQLAQLGSLLQKSLISTWMLEG